MASPENPAPSAALQVELAEVQRRLEIADENENTIERFFRRDHLLELQEELEYEIEVANHPTEHI